MVVALASNPERLVSASLICPAKAVARRDALTGLSTGVVVVIVIKLAGGSVLGGSGLGGTGLGGDGQHSWDTGKAEAPARASPEQEK